MTRHAVSTPEAPQAIGPYSQALRCGEWLFVSGQIPLDPEGRLVPGGIAEQTERVILNIGAILRAEGLGLEHVAKTTVFLAQMKDFPAMNEIYARFFKAPFPARATVQAAALPRGVAVEIEAIATTG